MTVTLLQHSSLHAAAVNMVRMHQLLLVLLLVLLLLPLTRRKVAGVGLPAATFVVSPGLLLYPALLLC